MKQDELIDSEQLRLPYSREMEKGFRVMSTHWIISRSYESTLFSLNKMQGNMGTAVRVNSNRSGGLLFEDFGLPLLRRTPNWHPSVS